MRVGDRSAIFSSDEAIAPEPAIDFMKSRRCMLVALVTAGKTPRRKLLTSNLDFYLEPLPQPPPPGVSILRTLPRGAVKTAFEGRTTERRPIIREFFPGRPGFPPASP